MLSERNSCAVASWRRRGRRVPSLPRHGPSQSEPLPLQSPQFGRGPRRGFRRERALALGPDENPNADAPTWRVMRGATHRKREPAAGKLMGARSRKPRCAASAAPARVSGGSTERAQTGQAMSRALDLLPNGPSDGPPKSLGRRQGLSLYRPPHAEHRNRVGARQRGNLSRFRSSDWPQCMERALLIVEHATQRATRKTSPSKRATT